MKKLAMPSYNIVVITRKYENGKLLNILIGSTRELFATSMFKNCNFHIEFKIIPIIIDASINC